MTDPAVRRSRFAWLRDAPEAPAPANMVALLDRLDWVRGIGIARDRTTRVHPARLARLVEEGGIMIWLLGISPMVWRRVLVPNTCTLRELHGVIQVAMGWEGIHLYQFCLRSCRYGFHPLP